MQSVAHVPAWKGATVCPRLSFHLACKNWRKQAGPFTTKLKLSVEGPGRLRFAINSFPHLQSLHLHRVSVYFSQFEDIGKLSNLRRLSLVHLRSAEKADQLLLQWESGYRRSAFQFLQKLTSLELGAHRQTRITSEEYEGISHLTDLQHITLQQRPFPIHASGQSTLCRLSALTSLVVDELAIGLGIYWMSFLHPEHTVCCCASTTYTKLALYVFITFAFPFLSASVGNVSLVFRCTPVYAHHRHTVDSGAPLAEEVPISEMAYGMQCCYSSGSHLTEIILVAGPFITKLKLSEQGPDITLCH